SVFIENFIRNYIGMIDRKICSFLESNSKEFFCSIENSFFQNGIDFKIRFYLIFVQIILCFPHLFCIKIPIPRSEFKTSLLFINERLNFVSFPFSGFYSRLSKLHEKLSRFFGFLCHLILKFPFSKRFFT